MFFVTGFSVIGKGSRPEAIVRNSVPTVWQMQMHVPLVLFATFVRVGAHHHQDVPSHGVYHDHLSFVHPLLELGLLVRLQLFGEVVVLVEG